MTGWRIGYAIGNAEIIGGMTSIASQATSNPTAVSQVAAVEALIGEQETAEKMRQAFEERLNTIYPKVADLPGFNLKNPKVHSICFRTSRKRWRWVVTTT